MRNTLIAVSIFIHALVLAPAFAQEKGCPNRCPEGTIWSFETNKCETYKPMMV